MAETNAGLLLLSALLLGIFLGAQLAEACLFVPIWRRMKPDEFFEQHKTVGPMIYRFFAPLTVLATVIPLVTVALYWFSGSDSSGMLAGMGLASAAFFSTYFVYFKSANKKFATRAIADSELPDELSRWNRWHWVRIIFEGIAFVCCLGLLLAE
ncbi:MAG: DUF1772 domain-containing protein [Pseudomonadota bacterium]